MISRTNKYSVPEHGNRFDVRIERAGATMSNVTALGWMSSRCEMNRDGRDYHPDSSCAQWQCSVLLHHPEHHALQPNTNTQI
jgi:hypothetical protein